MPPPSPDPSNVSPPRCQMRPTRRKGTRGSHAPGTASWSASDPGHRSRVWSPSGIGKGVRMASTYDELTRRPAPPEAGWRQGFAFGKPGTRHGSITHALVSFVELFQREHRDERPPIAPTLAKLLVWIITGIAATSAGVVVLGGLVVRIWSGASG